VNQDCSFCFQAEEDITYNSTDSRNIVGGQNDGRVGFNQCGIDWSTNNGALWGDMLPPFRSRINDPASMEPTATDPNRNTIAGGPGSLHTYDAASDPANAVDANGRAYFSCVVFDLNDNANGVFVTQSPAYAKGAFYYNVPSAGRPFMPVEDNSVTAVHDKNMISADRYSSSPNKGNVYLTWTVFKFAPTCGAPPDGTDQFCSAIVYGSMSTDGGFNWSTPENIAGVSPLCFFGNAFDPSQPANACNDESGSYSVALPNGDLEVIFNNDNTNTVNDQQLGIHCHPSGNSATGTAHLNCMSAVKVGDDIVAGEPQCDFGRGPEECVPGPFIRTNDFPRITKDNTQNNHLYAAWQDYRQRRVRHPAVAVARRRRDVARGRDGQPDTGLDHYMAATDQSPSVNDRVGVSYYRSARVPNENTTPSGGFASGQPGVQASRSDFVLAGGTGSSTPYAFRVVSPVFPPPDGNQAGFNGDYSGLTINNGLQAHPIWSDTRNVSPDTVNGSAHDEDIFTDIEGLPAGTGGSGTGTIGRN
jgi:hypothetical protein